MPDGVMLDGAYRLELPEGARNVIVRNNRVVEADPELAHTVGRTPGDVRRWVQEQGGHMTRIGTRPSSPPNG